MNNEAENCLTCYRIQRLRKQFDRLKRRNKLLSKRLRKQNKILVYHLKLMSTTIEDE